jgi:hypothetical protein
MFKGEGKGKMGDISQLRQMSFLILRLRKEKLSGSASLPGVPISEQERLLFLGGLSRGRNADVCSSRDLGAQTQGGDREGTRRTQRAHLVRTPDSRHYGTPRSWAK